MSCPSWRELAADREPHFGGQEAEPAWREALEHFDSGCPRCRREALAADPVLVFRRLPRVEMSDAQEAAEVDAVIQAVAAMRTASRVESLERRSHAGGWKRWTAAAVLMGASLSIPADNGWKRLERSELAAPLVLPGASMPAAWSEAEPTLEGVNIPDARVYHMDSNDVDGVMIFSESLAESLDV